MSVTFKIDTVSPRTPRGKEITCFESLRRRLEKEERFSDNKIKTKPFYEAHSSNGSNVCYRTDCHGFIDVASKAYANHLPLCISVEDVKLTIVQQFAVHVNQNSESLRNQLVDHDKKKEIIVIRNDFVKGTMSSQQWQSVFHEFTQHLHSDVVDKDLVSKITTRTSVSTDITQAAVDIGLLDVFQKYYDYTLMTLCGIPSITLLGTINDWIGIKDLLNHISQFEFDWYTSKLIPIINEFIAAVEGNVNTEFWQNMVKSKDKGSGTTEYHGWIKYFFAYDDENRRLNNTNTSHVTTDALTSGISSVPFVWKYFGRPINMTLYAGFAAIGVNERGEIHPVIAWAIQDMDASKTNYKVPRVLSDCVNKGCHRTTCMGRYGPNRGISCDYCKKNFSTAPCVSYGEKTDICMKCYDDIVAIMKIKGIWQHEGTEALFCSLCCTELVSSNDYVKSDVQLRVLGQDLVLERLCNVCHGKLKSI